jgi:starch phosphorylase
MNSTAGTVSQVRREHTRTAFDVNHLKRAFVDSLIYDQARYPGRATTLDYYQAVAASIRDRVVERWVNAIRAYSGKDVRIVCYLSAEFLLGPHLGIHMLNLGLTPQATDALQQLEQSMEAILDEEPEPGLGNGGLGRLAACYMESLSTLQGPAVGFGIRYEYGIFDQAIHDGWQVEMTDKWLRWGNPWEIPRPEGALDIKFGGRTESYTDAAGRYCVRWMPDWVVKAVPYDTPISGYRTNTVNTLRLWKAEAVEAFNFDAFNVGNYFGSVREKMRSENISKILYPNDEEIQGKELRLEQQFFFVSASLQNLVNIHLRLGRRLEEFHEKWAVQMNDTHPSLSVAELMRLFIDERGLSWDAAWNTTRKTLGYTNHTLLPEALEKWPVSLFGRLLPRHLEIIYEINRRFLNEVQTRFPGDEDRIRRMSLIDETGERYVRMAHLASVGSHAINGVAALHTELLKKDVLRDFYDLYPERFSNKTNGVTPRRWIALANPGLAQLITTRIGDQWLSDLEQLRKLESHLDDAEFIEEWRNRKHDIKRQLGGYVEKKTGIVLNPASMFDVMAKRIHEYKRQHLKVLHIIALYHRIKSNPQRRIVPRTFLFGGKAAPGYYIAKLIIKLINSVGDVVNNDPDTRDRLRVVFLPDFNISFGQRLYPAADLSEQISLAGKEASGTGNMKFAMNGALTVGTLDGANVEIREAVGKENFFVFGLTAEQVYATKSSYDPQRFYNANPELKTSLDSLSAGAFSHGDTNLFRPLVESLLYRDPYMLLADFASYVECQDGIEAAYTDSNAWTRMSILNTLRTGYFSSDRSIREYCDEIWNTKPVPVDLADLSPEV